MTVRLALLSAAATAVVTATAAEIERKPAETQSEMEQRIEDARRRLDIAAEEVAELSMSMSDYTMPQVLETRALGRPRAILGVNLGPRSDEAPESVAIVSVSPGGSAESAGLKAGDVLLAIGDKQLKRDEDTSARDLLMKEMEQVKPGEKVQLRYRRADKIATATVTVQAPPDRIFAMRDSSGSAAGLALPRFATTRIVGAFGSAQLVSLMPKLGQYFGTEKGLLVVRAPADGRLMLEDGDVIIDINGRIPSSPSHAFRILGSYQAGEKLTLNILRQQKKMSFNITVPSDGAPLPSPIMLDQGLQRPLIEGPGSVEVAPLSDPMIEPIPPSAPETVIATWDEQAVISI